jgi:predicted TIM-barrel fold metal-dependent hydrolase
MRFGYDFMGAEHLLFASDHPWVDPRLNHAGLNSLELPVTDREKMLRANAFKSFDL